MADIDNIPQLMTIGQLAERLGVTERFIRRLVAERRPVPEAGPADRCAEHEIAEWFDSTRRP